MPIDVVAKATGVSAGLLRMWEVRYGWPRPHRRPNGYRAYSRGLVEMIKQIAALVNAGHVISDLIVDGVPSRPLSESPIFARWSRYAQIPPAPGETAAEFRDEIHNAITLRNVPALLLLMHKANIVLRPQERLVAAWMPAYFGAMEWASAGRPLSADIGRIIGRVAGAEVLANVIARWQTAEAIG